MNHFPKLTQAFAALIILSGTVACQQEPETSIRTSSSSAPRPRVPVVIDENDSDNGGPGGGGSPITTTTTVTTTSGLGTTTTTMSGGGGGGGGGAGPALSGIYTGMCYNAGAFYFRTRYSFSGMSVRIEEMYYSDSNCGAAREGSIYTGTIATGAMNGQGYNIDFNVTRTGYYIAPSEDLASFNDAGNPFCGRSSGWMHGENQLEQGNPCRQVFLDFRVYNIAGQALQMSGRGRTAAERSNILSEVYAR